MTNKELLEEIKNTHWENLKTSQILYVSWLIEQAQELESLKDAFDDLDSDYIDLQQENERYREALEEINQLWERSTDATDDTNLAWKMSCEAHKAMESGNGGN